MIRSVGGITSEELDQPDRLSLAEAAQQMGCPEEHVEKLILQGKLQMVRTTTGTPMVLTPLPRYRKPWRGRLYREDRAFFEFARHLRFLYFLGVAGVFVALVLVPGFAWGSTTYVLVRWGLLAVIAVAMVIGRFLMAKPRD